MVQVGLCRAVALGDKPLRRTIGQETLDLWLIRIEFALAGPAWPSECYPCRLLRLKRLFRALRDQIALNFGGHGERHGDDRALHAAVELPLPFDRVQVDPFLYGNRKVYDGLRTFMRFYPTSMCLLDAILLSTGRGLQSAGNRPTM